MWFKPQFIKDFDFPEIFELAHGRQWPNCTGSPKLGMGNQESWSIKFDWWAEKFMSVNCYLYKKYYDCGLSELFIKIELFGSINSHFYTDSLWTGKCFCVLSVECRGRVQNNDCILVPSSEQQDHDVNVSPS